MFEEQNREAHKQKFTPVLADIVELGDEVRLQLFMVSLEKRNERVETLFENIWSNMSSLTPIKFNECIKKAKEQFKLDYKH